MLETHGSYDRAVHASKFNGPHEHRADKTMAPHWREYRPDKWVRTPHQRSRAALC